MGILTNQVDIKTRPWLMSVVSSLKVNVCSWGPFKWAGVPALQHSLCQPLTLKMRSMLANYYLSAMVPSYFMNYKSLPPQKFDPLNPAPGTGPMIPNMGEERFPWEQ